MPTHLQHRHHAGHGPCSPHLLTLGLTLIVTLSLSACGPAHQGQLTVEPANASAEPNTVDDTLRNSLDGPERHDLQRHDRHVAPAGRHTQKTGRDIIKDQPGLQLRHRRMSSNYLL